MLFNWGIAPRRGNEHLAQGITLGKQQIHIARPVGATAANTCSKVRAFALAGRNMIAYNIPRALPWASSLLAFQADSVELVKLELRVTSYKLQVMLNVL